MLDRDLVEAEEVSVDDEEENGFLKAFKVFLPLTILPLLLVFSESVFTDFNAPLESMLNCILIFHDIQTVVGYRNPFCCAQSCQIITC